MPSDRQSPTALASHLSCPHLTQLERQRRAGTLKIEFTPDPRVEGLAERGRQHEAAYVERLRAEGRTIGDLTDSRDPATTVKAMREGFGAIVQAPLGDDAFFGIADVLLRCDTPSALGAWSYEPVDTKLSRETKAATVLQLATYCELLAPAQALPPEHFHVVTPIATETYRVDDFVAYFRLVRSQFQAASIATPAPATYPEPVGHCDVCKYWRYCDTQRRKDDHPSLIAGIHRGQVREFQAQDIQTVVAIAKCDGKLPNAPKRGRRESYATLGQQARLQVAARKISPPPLEYLTHEPARGFARLPEPSPGDIFLDFEGDPFAGENGLEYLTGYHVREIGPRVIGAVAPPGATASAASGVTLTQLWALDGKAEKAALERFIDFATERWQKYEGLHIYHFGAYEPATLKRLCARYETRREELDRFLRGGIFIDLHTVVREAMRIGIERYGLKELEEMHGFEREQDLAEAGVSRRDVELAIELNDLGAITPDLRDRVARYNAEDCLSTEALRIWLEAQRALRVAAGIAIERPPAKPPEPSEEVGERDRRIQTLKDELTARHPDDPAVALLASMLGYFRQEEKNAYWEHFRLRDLPPEERLDEREMLAGLEFVAAVPKTGRQKSERRRYRFPPQEYALKAGETAVFTQHEDPDEAAKVGTQLGIEEIDPVARTIVLSCSKFVPDKHPTAVFGEQVVGRVKDLENALLAFAEDVRDHGFAPEGPYAVTSALLLHIPPQRETGKSLRRDHESALNAAKRLASDLDHEVLPIQGPPGSGKTFTGARVILDLVRKGKRIGVTAVSHKVIDNLLLAIKEAAARESTEVRLVHKDKGDPPAGIEYFNDPAAALATIATGTVVGGTVWLWADDDAMGQLDYLFVDEAGQMSLANALAASRCARNLVLLGDPQQLEQPQRGAHPEGADVAALVHVVGKGNKTLAYNQGLFLDETHRLHPAICAFTSEAYYENKLHPIAGLERQQVQGKTPFSGSGLFLVNVPHEGNQAVAREEVEAVARICESLLTADITWTEKDGTIRPMEPKDLLVVAPYNAQVSALRDRLAALGVERVGTVDKFQGQEAPVVIYSCTSSSPEDAPRGMSFLYDPHRFNVATSRAQGVCIVVASPALFEPECRTPEQMRWANGLCRYREMAQAVSFPG